MGLPLIDGVFISIVLSNQLNSIMNAIIVGSFILGGGATISVILSEFNNNTKTTIKRILIIGFILSTFAMFQALISPIIKSILIVENIKIGAMIAILLLAYNILPQKSYFDKIKPGYVVVISILFSLQLSELAIAGPLNYRASLYAFIASVVSIIISITTVVVRPYLINDLNINILHYMTSFGLLTVVLSMMNIIPSICTLFIFASGLILSFIID